MVDIDNKNTRTTLLTSSIKSIKIDTLEEYKVIYPEGTFDYITKGDFNGVHHSFVNKFFKEI